MRCNECDVDLVAELPPLPEKKPQHSGKTVDLALVKNGFEADILLSALKDAGIEAYLRRRGLIVEKWTYVPAEERVPEYLDVGEEYNNEAEVIIDIEDRDKAVEVLVEMRKAMGLEE
jgi:hypothetical protein